MSDLEIIACVLGGIFVICMILWVIFRDSEIFLEGIALILEMLMSIFD